MANASVVSRNNDSDSSLFEYDHSFSSSDEFFKFTNDSSTEESEESDSDEYKDTPTEHEHTFVTINPSHLAEDQPYFFGNAERNLLKWNGEETDSPKSMVDSDFAMEFSVPDSDFLSSSLKLKIPIERKHGAATHPVNTPKTLVDDLEMICNGLKRNQHGVDYQLQILMLALWRAKDGNYARFRLGTELPGTEKLYDAVFQYCMSADDKWKFRLFQIKHKEGSNIRSINKANLLSRGKDHDFDIAVYFKSLMDIEIRCSEKSLYSPFSGGEVEDVCLITNADLSSDELKSCFSIDSDNLNNDKLLGFKDLHTRRSYRIVKNSDLANELIPIFHAYSDFNKLIQMLASNNDFESKTNEAMDVLKKYICPLKKFVFDCEEKNKDFILKFSKEFLENRSSREEVQNFRSHLMKEIAFLKNEWKFKVSNKFGRKKRPNEKAKKLPKVNFTENKVLNATAVNQIVQALVDASRTGNQLESIFVGHLQIYQEDLAKYVIDVKTGMFHDTFIKGDVNNMKVTSNVLDIRRALIEKIVENVEIPITQGLASHFLKKTDLKLNDSKKLAGQIFRIVPTAPCTEKSIEISKTKIDASDEEWESFKSKLQVLSEGHIIVQKYGALRFSSKFLQMGEVDDTFENFRKDLFQLISAPMLQNISFKLNNYLVRCYDEEDTLKLLPQPYKEEDFENFFDKFKLIVNYPNRDKLSNLLKKEMKEKFQNLNNELYHALYGRTLQRWMTDRMGTFYTPETVQKLFNNIGLELDCLKIEGINLSYFGSIPQRYAFKTIEYLLRDHFESDQQIMVLSFDHLILGRIRVSESFEKLRLLNEAKYQKYTNVFGHMFLSAEQLKRQKIKEELEKVLEKKDLWNLIVIDCDVTESDNFKAVYELIYSNWRLNTKRKFVLIEDNRNAVKGCFTNTRKIRTIFKDLNKSCQKYILSEKHFSLQGTELPVGEFLDGSCLDMIDTEILVKFIQEDKIEIGRKLPYSKDNNLPFYIPRVLKTGKNPISEESAFYRYPRFVLSSIAGMGKSTILSNLSKKIKDCFPHYWVIRIDLNNFIPFLNSMLNCEEMARWRLKFNFGDSAIDFLVNLLKSKENSEVTTNFESKLLKGILKKSSENYSQRFRIALLIDGFGEISPLYHGICLDFFKGIYACDPEYLIITTRPCCKEAVKLKYVYTLTLQGLTDVQKYLLVKERLVKELLQVYWQHYFSLQSNFYFSCLDKPILCSYPTGENICRPWDGGVKCFGNFKVAYIDLNDVLPLVSDRQKQFPTAIFYDCLCETFKQFKKKAEFVVLGEFDGLHQKYQDVLISNTRILSCFFLVKIIILTNKCLEDDDNNTYIRTKIPSKVHLTQKYWLGSKDVALHPLHFDFQIHGYLLSHLRFCFRSTYEFNSTPGFCKVISGEFVYRIENMRSIIQHEKLGQDGLKDAAKEPKIKELKSYIEEQKKLAIYALFYFRKETLKILLSQFGVYEDVLKEIKERLKQIVLGNEKGDLINATDGEAVIFIDRSRAEHLVAEFIGDVLYSNGQLDECKDFWKLCINCPHSNPERYETNQKYPPSDIFSEEICKLFQKSLEKKGENIAKNLVDQWKIWRCDNDSENGSWVSEPKTLLSIFASYPELFERIYELLNSKGEYGSMYEMYWDVADHYGKHISCYKSCYKRYILCSPSHYDFKESHSFHVNNFENVREKFKIPVKSPLIDNCGNMRNFSCTDLQEYVRKANFGFPSEFSQKVNHTKHSMTICFEKLFTANRIIKYYAVELMRYLYYDEMEPPREWTREALRAALCAWSLEYANLLDETEKKFDSLLHIACNRGYSQLLKWLLDKGYPINLNNGSGETPLHYLTPGYIDSLVKEKVLDSRYQTDPDFLEEEKNKPVKCPKGLMPSNKYGSSWSPTFGDGFNLVLGSWRNLPSSIAVFKQKLASRFVEKVLDRKLYYYLVSEDYEEDSEHDLFS